MTDSSFTEGFLTGQNSGRNDGYGDGMWGGGGWWAWILLFAIFGGWGNGFGGWGGGNGALQGALTRSDLCAEFNANDLQNAVRGVQQGICDSTFALQNSILNGFHGIDNAICSLGYEQANLSNATNVAIMQAQNAIQTQASDCCCRTQTAIGNVENAITGLGCSLGREIERGFAETAYRMATDTCAIQTQMANNTRDIIDSQQAGTRAILDWLCAKETADLRAENQSLKLAASQERQNNYLVNTLRPMPQPSYITCNPFTGMYGGYGPYGYNGYGYNNNSCGCNSGCCGCNG